MKICFSLFLSLGFCALAATTARADDNNGAPTLPYDPDINSPSYDGSTFRTAQDKKPSASEIQAAREKQDEDSDWLMRSYEQQQKMDITRGQGDSSDSYQRILANSDLAKLAGLTTPAAANPSDITSLHVGADSLKAGPTLRIEPSQNPATAKFPSMTGGSFKPLVTPLSATDAAGLHNFYASLPAGTPPANPAAPSAAPSANDANSMTEMPGLTAAGGRITQGKTSYDLTFEQLPDDFHEHPLQSLADKDLGLLPQVPSGNAADQLHRTVVIETTGKPAPQAPPAKLVVVLPPDPEVAPVPVTAPMILAGRPQIQTPEDYFR